MTQLKKDNNTLLLFFDQFDTIWSLTSEDQTLKLKLEYQEKVEFKYFEYCYLENQNAFVLISRKNLFFYQYKQKDNDQLDILDGQDQINDFCISNDEDMIASVGKFESILWKKSDDIYKQIAELPGGDSIVIFENDNYLAICNEDQYFIEIVSLKNRLIKLDIIQDYKYQLIRTLQLKVIFQIVNDKLFVIYWNISSRSGNKNEGEVIYFDQIKKSFQMEGITEFNQLKFNNDYIQTILVNPQNFEIIYIHPSYIQIENKINQNFLKRIEFKSIRDFIYEFNKYYIVADYEQIVFLNLEGNRIYSFDYNGYVKNIHFIYSTRYLIIGEGKGNITIFNCEKIELENESENPIIPYHQFQSLKKLTAIAISNQYQIIISAHDNYLYFWDIRSKQKILSFSAHQQQITSILIFKDAKQFVTGSEDKTFKIWDLEAIQKVQDDEAHYDSLEKIKFESVNEVITYGLDISLCIWNVKQKQFVKKINNIKNFIHFQARFFVFDEFDKIYYFKNQNDENNNFLCLEIFKTNIIKVLDWDDIIDFESDLFHCFIRNKLFLRKFGSEIFIKDQEAFLFYLKYYFSQLQKKKSFKITILLDQVDSSSSQSIPLKYRYIKNIIFYLNQIFFIQFKDKNLYVLELLNLEVSEFKQLEGHQSSIKDIIYSNQYVITYDRLGMIIFWLRADYSQQIFIMRQILQENNLDQSDLFIIGKSNQTEQLATSHINGYIYVWDIQDLKNFKLQNQLTIVSIKENKNYEIKQIEFSPDDKILACLYQDIIWFYNLTNQELSNQVMRSSFYCKEFFFFHPKLPQIFCKRYDKLVAYHFLQFFYYKEMNSLDKLKDLKFSYDKNFLAYIRQLGCEQKLQIYDIKQSKIINSFDQKRNQDCQLNFSLFNKFISSLFQKFYQLQVWIIENKTTHLELDNIVSAEFTNDEKAIFVASTKQDLQIISLESKEIIQTLTNFQHSIKAICFSPNNQLFFLGLNDGTLLLYAFSKDAVKNPQSNSQNQQDYSIKPFCYKSFSRYSQLLANGCILNEKSVIETQNKQSLIQTFLQKEAILTKEQIDEQQLQMKLDKEQNKSEVDQQKE